MSNGTIVGVWNGPEFGGTYEMTGKETGSSFKVTSAYCTAFYSPAGCTYQNLANQKTTTYNFPYANLISGNTKITHTINETHRTIKFEYTIRKTSNY